jgi:glycosyltransferase involved in cell wall biosynthesis
MKTAILMPLAEQRGGAEQLLRLFLRYLPDDPVNWIPIFFESGPLVEEARTLGFDVQILPTGRLRQPIRYTRAVGQLTRLFRQKQVTLVLSWMGKAHLYGGVAARVGGIPAIWFQHGIPQGRAWMDRLITRIPAAGVLACSQAAAEAQRQLRPERSIIVVYPAVDLSAFDPDSLPTPLEARRQLGLPENGPLIGMVGRLQRWKGMHTLVQAMPQILERYPEASAVIVGGRHELEPDYEDELRRLINWLGLQDRVWLTGFQTDIPRWMQAMDVVVHASDREPFGVVVIEAMALGKPVVAGSEGGPLEIITEGVDGLLAPYEDVETLARQIRRYLDDPDFARRVGAAARQRARDFQPERFALRIMEALRHFSKTAKWIAPSAHK